MSVVVPEPQASVNFSRVLGRQKRRTYPKGSICIQEIKVKTRNTEPKRRVILWTKKLFGYLRKPGQSGVLWFRPGWWACPHTVP